MNEISLFPDEKVVMHSDGDILTLTTKRIRYHATVLGSSQLISITLDSVASCGLVTKSYPLLIVLAALSLGGAIFGGDGSASFFFLAIVFGVAYFFTRKAVISVTSDGGKAIQAPVKNMSKETIVEFLDSIEREKFRFMSL